MFLKSLTIKGFKSFADTTTLEFEPGVTVVVGPNGSGKSNVVDAVAWVLGAQGARTIRSSKMEDVIFAGSPKRPALGRAEVALTIDNTAGLLPIDFSEVTITRTLFRGGESEYAINRVPCRLLDVQELLSDSGIGRQQHVIVSQGNLDAILNARPEERRLVIEEAAGILKFRRRKERAERRLESSEASLVRLQDLQRELKRQLRPLEKQAEAARRHDGLVDELTGLRRFLLGGDLASLRARLGEITAERELLVGREAGARTAVSQCEQAVREAEEEAGETPLAVEAELSDLDARARALKARASGLEAVIAERRRSIEREGRYAGDAEIVADLELELAALRRRLHSAESEAADLLPAADELAEAERELELDRRSIVEGEGDLEAAVGDPAAEVRGELGALKLAAERLRRDLDGATSRAASVAERMTRLEAESSRWRAALGESEAQTEECIDADRRSVESEEAAEANRTSSEERWRSTSAERSRWAAREEALAQALDEARARAGVQRLAGSKGVVGTLLELVEVDEGFSAAFEAAAGEILAAVVLDSVASAREGLAELHRQEATGAVVALDVEGKLAMSGLPGLSGLSGLDTRDLPAGCRTLRSRVRGTRSDVDPLLDELLGRAIVVEGGWAHALDLALERRELIVVTPDGDRFSGGLWRAGASGSGATGAALEEARTRARSSDEAVNKAKSDFEAAQAALASARLERADAARRLASNATSVRSARDALQRADTEIAERTGELEELSELQADLVARVQRDERRIAELAEMLPALEEMAAREASRRDEAAARRALLAERTAALAGARKDLEVRAAGLEERRDLTLRRLAEVESSLERQTAERVRRAERREAAEASVGVVAALESLVKDRASIVAQVANRVGEARRVEAEARASRMRRLETLRGGRSAAADELARLGQRINSLDVAEAEARTRLEALVESARRDLGEEPEISDDAGCPSIPEGVTPRQRRDDLERELRNMGPINPLALEEHTALLERSRFTESQLDDVRSARRELTKVIQAIDVEITGVFAEAYADVAANFEKLFARLFPGGEGRLELTDPQNMLETGIEVAARPSGKNLRRLSLLSGGERSLVAMAYLFAVFRSRPSPFYMMDEVEAALDDLNLHRFLDLLEEFRSEAQLLIVSHQKRTMEAADCLYGVTMAPGGASVVVSEKQSERRTPADA